MVKTLDVLVTDVQTQYSEQIIGTKAYAGQMTTLLGDQLSENLISHKYYEAQMTSLGAG